MKDEDWSLVDGEQTRLGRVIVLDQVASTQDEVRRCLQQDDLAGGVPIRLGADIVAWLCGSVAGCLARLFVR